MLLLTVRFLRTIVRNMRTKKKGAVDWLFPEVRKKVLILLLGDPDKRWYLRDIERMTGLAVATVHRELAGLVDADVITKSKDGNRTYYQANSECPFLPELTGLLRKTAALVDVLADALRPLSKKIEAAFIYGSIAADFAKAASDVDVMVIGNCTLAELVEALMPAQKELDREINPTIYPVDEFRNKVAAQHHFLKAVLSEKKIWLIGDEDGLGKLAQE
jgi:predicted nucleotidyltransferase